MVQKTASVGMNANMHRSLNDDDDHRKIQTRTYEPISPTSTSFEELKACHLTSSIESASPLQGRGLKSQYHIYHSKLSHQRISPSVNSPKERFWGPTTKEKKEKRKRRRESQAQAAPVEDVDRDELVRKVTTMTCGSGEEDNTQGYFLHMPYLAFHEPPRILYVGDSKHCEPAVMIHSSFLWRTWKLQVGPFLSTPGVLDPRGVVSWRHDGGSTKALKQDDRKLKGYKVRTWRLWGETGKEFVKKVKAARKEGRTEDDPDVVGRKEDTRSNAVRADEVVYLKWTSPFSNNTRRYQFRYRGIDFAWKGTGTVKESRSCGWMVHFNHLKLVARVCTPGYEEDEGMETEVCLGRYTSSIAKRKCGSLELFDAAIWRLVTDYMPSVDSQKEVERQGKGGEAEASESEGEEGDVMAQIAAVKKTPLYQLIVSTAMCMIIGEKQKRETVRRILETAAGEAGGGG